MRGSSRIPRGLAQGGAGVPPAWPGLQPLHVATEGPRMCDQGHRVPGTAVPCSSLPARCRSRCWNSGFLTPHSMDKTSCPPAPAPARPPQPAQGPDSSLDAATEAGAERGVPVRAAHSPKARGPAWGRKGGRGLCTGPGRGGSAYPLCRPRGVSGQPALSLDLGFPLSKMKA